MKTLCPWGFSLTHLYQAKAGIDDLFVQHLFDQTHHLLLDCLRGRERNHDFSGLNGGNLWLHVIVRQGLTVNPKITWKKQIWLGIRE